MAPDEAIQRHLERVAGHWRGLNLSGPKARVVRTFLSGPTARWGGAGADRLAVWASRPNRAVHAALARTPQRVVRIEDGFIRSVGLGAGFTGAGSIVLDTRGIYYDPAGSDLRHILETTAFDPALLAQAALLRQRIGELALTKYNLDCSPPDLAPPAGRRLILVPGQVANDASVRLGGMGLDNGGLLRRVREANPEAWIIYKEHPDVTAGYRPGRLSAEDGRLADVEVRDTDILTLIDLVDEVHVLSSLTGFEALLRDRCVVTWGLPFYAGWGLTTDRSAPRRGVTLSLDALVAGALILYPLYLDPFTQRPCSALTFVEQLAAWRAIHPARAPRNRGRWTRYLTAVRQMLGAR